MRFHQKLSGYSLKRKCRHPDVTPATGHTGGCRETIIQQKTAKNPTKMTKPSSRIPGVDDVIAQSQNMMVLFDNACVSAVAMG